MMKLTRRLFTVAMCLTLVMAGGVTVFASDAISVTIDGQAVAFADQTPVLVDGRTLVPVRGVFEQLGFEVDWNDAARQAILTSDDYTIVITIGSATFTTNGESHTLDVPAQLIGGRTMVPLRFPLESVGYYLDWDGGTRTVIVSSTPIAASPPTQPAGDRPAYITIRGVQYSTDLTRLVFGDDIKEVGFDFFDLLTCEDIAPLRYMTNLEYLSLDFNRITDISPLAGLTNLRTLWIGVNEITDISPLAGLTSLEFLSLGGNEITDISPLTGLINLETLWIGFNEITDISPLTGLTNLEYLSLDVNEITDISPLTGLTNLRSLGLDGNHITDITPLTGLTNLRSLGLYGNHITDIAPLAGLTNLEYLSLGGNEITDITPLAGLANLESVGLSDNPIIDWSPVSHVQWVWGRP